MSTDFIEELRWRGILHDIMPGTEELLAKETTTGYIGFDPTADSLHVGSLAQIMTLVRFQKAGHKPLALVGGATGMVGDPSGKSAERNLLDNTTLDKNVAGIQKQLSKFLDFNDSATGAELVNNYDWFKNYSFLDFIREAGKHITVNYMMAKDSVKNRITGDTGMSFTEFSYQLIQGYDFFHLWNEKNCKLQMGGSDQWGNITTGTEFIRRKAGGEAFALTTQLIKKSDGTKFGKSESGNIWLDPEKTSPYDFYQFWLRTTDDDAKSYMRIFTMFTKVEIEDFEFRHGLIPENRVLQKALAKDITIRVHGEEEFLKAERKSLSLFTFNKESLMNLKRSSTFNEVKEKVEATEFTIDSSVLENGINIIDLLVHENTKIMPSKNEARKMIANGGIYIDFDKITDPNFIINRELNLVNDYILLQKGKKNFYWINFI